MIKNVKNPVRVARKVMEKTQHVYLVGESAERLAMSENLDIEDDLYFHTDKRYEQLIQSQIKNHIIQDHHVEEKEENFLMSNKNLSTFDLHTVSIPDIMTNIKTDSEIKQAARRERLAAELRQNLLKGKAQVIFEHLIESNLKQLRFGTRGACDD